MAHKIVEEMQKVAPKEDFTWLDVLINALEKDQTSEDNKMALKIATEEIPILIKARYSTSVDTETISKLLDIAKIGLTIAAK